VGGRGRAQVIDSSACPIGAIEALMNRVLQPRPLVVLGLNVWMGTAAGADEPVEVPYRDTLPAHARCPPPACASHCRLAAR
jgi:hypothetical protein